jgi:hypothetical protein
LEIAEMAEGVSIFTPPKSPPTNSAPAQVERRDAPVRSATSADGVVSSPTVTPAQQRWQADRDAIRRGDPWSDPSVVITKDADGTIRTRPRADGGQNGVPQPDAGGQQQPQQLGPATVTQDGRLKVGDVELTPDQVRGGPVSGPLIGMAKEFAHKHGIDQDGFSKMMGLFASYQLNEERRFKEAQAAEVQKLGSNAPGRIDAIATFLESQVGSELAGALRRSMFTAQQVTAYERLMRNFVSQGVGGRPAGGRDGAGSQPERATEEQISRMSYSERQAYAAKFDQRQFGGG